MTNDLYFDVEFTVKARIKINKEVFNQVDDDWKKSFYDIDTDSDVVEMIAYNLIHGRKLSQLDGFANLQDKYASWVRYPEFEVERVKEVK
jgi:hypothetical protein